MSRIEEMSSIFVETKNTNDMKVKDLDFRRKRQLVTTLKNMEYSKVDGKYRPKNIEVGIYFNTVEFDRLVIYPNYICIETSSIFIFLYSTNISIR